MLPSRDMFLQLLLLFFFLPFRKKLRIQKSGSACPSFQVLIRVFQHPAPLRRDHLFSAKHAEEIL
ncbi:MAG: hypothetical protein DRH50_06240 [Deltaproteobacteria bacterium]|nr:MAG: hypothetical protein DRH50_06240 [Deltaproteobacteria bacterium]